MKVDFEIDLHHLARVEGHGNIHGGGGGGAGTAGSGSHYTSGTTSYPKGVMLTHCAQECRAVEAWRDSDLCFRLKKVEARPGQRVANQNARHMAGE